MVCLLTSAVCHLFGCCAAHVAAVLWRFDYAGIAVLIVASFFPPVYYGEWGKFVLCACMPALLALPVLCSSPAASAPIRVPNDAAPSSAVAPALLMRPPPTHRLPVLLLFTTPLIASQLASLPCACFSHSLPGPAGFLCSPWTRLTYLVITSLLGLSTLCVTLLSQFQKTEWQT